MLFSESEEWTSGRDVVTLWCIVTVSTKQQQHNKQQCEDWISTVYKTTCLQMSSNQNQGIDRKPDRFFWWLMKFPSEIYINTYSNTTAAQPWKDLNNDSGKQVYHMTRNRSNPTSQVKVPLELKCVTLEMFAKDLIWRWNSSEKMKRFVLKTHFINAGSSNRRHRHTAPSWFGLFNVRQ